MKSFNQFLAEQKKSKKKNRCWTGYKPVPGKKPYSDGSCVKEQSEWTNEMIQQSAWNANSPKENPFKLGNPLRDKWNFVYMDLHGHGHA